MSVSTGQAATATVFNGAFISRTADTSSVGRVTLNNTSYVVSGPMITNVQRYINELADIGGVLAEGDATAMIYATNWQIANGQDRKEAIEALDGAFDAASGHGHSGAAGDGGPISGAVVTGVPYKGYFNQGIDLTGASGLTTDVSTELTGKSPSTSSAVLGVAVTAPYNKVVLRYATGANSGDEIVDSLGNQIYARVTESVGVWTLTYYVDLAGVETTHSLSSTNVRWYYQELFNTMVATPVYEQQAIIPSDNATADVIDASETASGKVLLSNVVATSVGSANVKGTAARVSHEDHAHQGIHALQEFTEAVNVFSDVVLKAGSGITITRTGQTFEFVSSGAGSQVVDYFTLSAGDITAKQVTLSLAPGSPTKVQLDVIGGGSQVYTVDFTVSGAILSWASLGLDGVLAAADQLRVIYAADLQVEYRTLTGGEVAAKQLTLAGSPSSAPQTVVDLVGGSAQVYTTDFTVSGAILGWTGLGLDGLVIAGDILRIVYRV